MSISSQLADILKKDIIEALQESIGFNDDIAEGMAARAFKKIQSRWGGREVYIPAADSQERNELIKSEFNGRNHTEICTKYQISLSTLYRVIGQRSEKEM